MQCNKRYLRKLFIDEGETLSNFIWQSRRECIRKDLSDGRALGRSITDLAFDWGFNSTIHFSRSFRERFGISPRGNRTMAHADAAYWNRLRSTALQLS